MDQLIPNSAWKDYSANTNYAFDGFAETEEKTQQNTKSRSRSTSQHQNGVSQQTTLQMSHSPSKTQYYDAAAHNGTHRNGRQSNGGEQRHPNGERSYYNGEQINRTSYADRTYSLPRSTIQQQVQQQQMPNYYTQDRRSRNAMNTRSASADRSDTPDFYFMPSQRKYSGEVVRVYVDYNKDPK